MDWGADQVEKRLDEAEAHAADLEAKLIHLEENEDKKSEDDPDALAEQLLQDYEDIQAEKTLVEERLDEAEARANEAEKRSAELAQKNEALLFEFNEKNS